MSAGPQSTRIERLAARWGIVALLLAFVILALAYSIVSPLHEATDELRHYRFVRVIAETGRLPVQGQEACRSQSHHPPLFYALGALASFWIDTGKDICENPPDNPFWAYRYWDVGRDNKNQYLHGSDESFPWYGEALAVHIIRTINVLIGAGMVWLTWATARLIWPGKAAMALGATAFVAFNPMFLYMSGAINNDIIAAFSGAAVIYACIRLLSAPERLNWRWGIVLGCLYGLALMSKFNLAPIIILIAATVVWAARQKAFVVGSGDANSAAGSTMPARRPLGQILRLVLPVLLLILVVAAVLAGWWFIRNALLYGEPTGFQEVTELWGVRNPAESFGLAVSELPYAWTTLWGRFGFGQIPLPQLVYDGLLVIVAVALSGALLGFFRAGTRLRTMLLLLAANLLLFFLVLFNYMLVSPAGPNGRFVFPALSSLAILVFYGLSWWLATIYKAAGRTQGSTTSVEGARQATNLLSLVATVAMLALSILVLVGYLAPAYARPASLAEDDLSPNPVNARFDSLATLLGFDLSTTTLRPGEALDLELYWQVDAQPPGNYLLFVHLIDEAGTVVAQRDTHPGLGSFPSSLWRPGDRFLERIRVHLPETAYAPETATLHVGLYAPDSYRLAVSDAAGNGTSDSLAIAEIVIEPNEGVLPNTLAKDIGNDILLNGYKYDRRVLSAGDELAVTLYWKALRDVDADYVIRIRLIDAEGHERSAVDGRPAVGDAPTYTWVEGQSVEDVHILTMPSDLAPGRYSVDLTFVDNATGKPAHILADDGHQIDSHLRLAEIRIAE